MKVIKTISILLLCVGIFSAAAFAAEPCRRHGVKMERGHNEYVRSLMNELDLTPAQQERLLEQRKKQHTQSQQLRVELREKKKALQEELQKPKSDKGTLNRLTEEIKILQGMMLEDRVDGVMELKQTLSPEQYRSFQDKVQQHRKQRRSHE